MLLNKAMKEKRNDINFFEILSKVDLKFDVVDGRE